jgi:hypothetical protein
LAILVYRSVLIATMTPYRDRSGQGNASAVLPLVACPAIKW